MIEVEERAARRTTDALHEARQLMERREAQLQDELRLVQERADVQIRQIMVETDVRVKHAVDAAATKAVMEERRWHDEAALSNAWGETEDPMIFAEAWQLAEGIKLRQTLGLAEGVQIDPLPLADRAGWVLMGLSSQEDANRIVPDGKLFTLQDAAFEKANLNPHAKGAVKTMRKYIAGRGVAVSSPVDVVNVVIQDFWQRNTLGIRHKAMVRSVFIEGEYYVLHTLTKGKDTIRRIPPKEITGIETDPEDVETKWSYQRDFVAADTQKVTRYYADSAYYARLAQAEAEGIESLPRSTFHEALRRQVDEGDVLVQQIRWGEEGEKRGRVPMAAELPYFKMLEQLHQDAARRCHEQAKVIWFKKIVGRTSEATQRERRAPAGGVMLIETENVSYRTESPKLAAGDMEITRRMLLYTIGGGLQIPLHILDSNAENENYSSIKKSDNPFLQEVMDWQDFWDDHLRELLKVPIRAAILAKTLPDHVTINRYVQEAVWEVVDRVIHGVVNREPMPMLLRESQAMLEGHDETLTIPTEEAPISIIFPVLVHESPLEQAQALEIWARLGVSQQTLVTKLGLDWKEELAQQRAMREWLRQEQTEEQKMLQLTPIPQSYGEGELRDGAWIPILTGRTVVEREEAYRQVLGRFAAHGTPLSEGEVEELRGVLRIA